MGMFNINITGVGGHGCERKAKAGDKLYGRCARMTCPDCLAFDFMQRLRQMGLLPENTPGVKAEFVHWPGSEQVVVDDMLGNVRKSGHF